MPSKSIVKQIADIETEISACEKSLDQIERSTRLTHCTDSEKQFMKEEEKRLKKELKSHQQSLTELRKENGKSMFVSVVILGLIYAVYYFFYQQSS